MYITNRLMVKYDQIILSTPFTPKQKQRHTAFLLLLAASKER